MARKSAWIRELIDENKYVEALEMIDKMSLEDVESTEDLNVWKRKKRFITSYMREIIPGMC